LAKIVAHGARVTVYDELMADQPLIILFDGTCNVCNASVNFIMKHDRRERFTFASSRTSPGAELAARHGFTGPTPGSIVLILGDTAYSRSTATLQIVRRLDGLWPILYAFILIPRPLRDAAYKWFAARRHIFFGKNEQCVILPPSRRAGDRT
jgi:predicted DCC family thiol-disulfide oxidoreductase YuxK